MVDPSLRELLDEVATGSWPAPPETIGRLGFAVAHALDPQAPAVADLSPERDPGRNPLYQVSFALNNQPADALAMDGLRGTGLPVHTATSKFDLSLTLTETGGLLEGELEYSTDLFDRGIPWMQLLLERPIRRIDACRS